MVIDVNWTYCSNHFITYINMESLCGTPETNRMLYVNYVSTFFKSTPMASSFCSTFCSVPPRWPALPPHMFLSPVPKRGPHCLTSPPLLSSLSRLPLTFCDLAHNPSPERFPWFLMAENAPSVLPQFPLQMYVTALPYKTDIIGYYILLSKNSKLQNKMDSMTPFM